MLTQMACLIGPLLDPIVSFKRVTVYNGFSTGSILLWRRFFPPARWRPYRCGADRTYMGEILLRTGVGIPLFKTLYFFMPPNETPKYLNLFAHKITFYGAFRKSN